MNKEQLIGVLRENLKLGTISKEEVLALCDVDPAVSVSNPESSLFEGKKRFSVTNILYFIGGLILLIGIGTLLFRFWDDLSSFVKVAITLGIAVAAYISGILLRSDTQTVGIGVIAQVISGALLPVGIFITLDEMGLQNIGIGWITSVSIALTLLYILSLVLFRSIVFSFYSIAFGTWALYSIITYALTDSSTLISFDIYSYTTLALGLGYLFLASYVRGTSHRSLAPVLDFIGSMGFFIAVLVLGKYAPRQNVFWEIIGVLSLCGGLYLSSVTHNKNILKTTGLFIFIFIGKFTGEYFVDSFGWPIALIISGLVLIGVGFGLLRFGNRIKQ